LALNKFVYLYSTSLALCTILDSFFPFVSKHYGIFLSMKDTYDAILNCSFHVESVPMLP